MNSPTPSERDDDVFDTLMARLEGWDKAYPERAFPEPTDADREWIHGERRGLMDRIAASMGRHMASCIRDDLTKLREAWNRRAAPEAEAVEGARPLNYGSDRLWTWFSLSYASWLTMPRVMMHAMPQDWQDRMAALCEEWDAAWDSSEMPEPHVVAKRDGKFAKWPAWLLNYRYPDAKQIARLRIDAARGALPGEGK
jgi:hypothetical protein